ncbi:MAG: hypothetical protein BWX72_00791 [Firmicutes bacterium ADurb.Bin080]|nr:MAG: hypothetical protein BWX72_00791 [Firmicutes bacterium ADurb.Bin080]
MSTNKVENLNSFKNWPLKNKITLISIIGVIIIFLIVGMIVNSNDEKNKPKLVDLDISGYYTGVYKIDSSLSSELRMNLYDYDDDKKTGRFQVEYLNDINFWTLQAYGTFSIDYDKERISFNGSIKLVNGSYQNYSGSSDLKIRGGTKEGYRLVFQMDQNKWLYTFSKEINNI